MNTNAVSKYKNILETQKNDMLRRIEALEKDKTRKNGPISIDSKEQALQTTNDEVIDHLEDMELQKLKDISNALIRIEKGSFGLCATCEEQISESRLSALPYTPICLDCANEAGV